LSILVDGPYAATLDLALAVAIAASYRRKPLVQDAVFIGGVGLRGQVQPLANEGQAIGMAITDLPARIYVSSASAGLLEEMVPSASQILGVASINECLAKLKLL